MITIKKVTRLRVRISKSTLKPILIVFPFGLRQTQLFGSYFSSKLFITINSVISICFESDMITMKKVTKLRVRISKSTIKSILMVFPFGLRQTQLFGSYFSSTLFITCLLYTSPSPRDGLLSRMPSSA